MTPDQQFMATAERLPSLFTLSNEMVEILDLLETESGDESELEGRLAQVAANLATKVERCVWTVRDFENLAAARKAEARRLSDQAARLESVAGRLKLALRDMMQSTNQQRINTARSTVRLQNSPARVDVLDASLVPPEFQRTKVIVDTDKIAVRDHWKATGEIVKGCDIVRDQHVVIS